MYVIYKRLLMEGNTTYEEENAILEGKITSIKLAEKPCQTTNIMLDTGYIICLTSKELKAIKEA